MTITEAQHKADLTAAELVGSIYGCLSDLAEAVAGNPQLEHMYAKAVAAIDAADAVDVMLGGGIMIRR